MHVFLSVFPWLPTTAALFNHHCPLPQAKGLSPPDARGCWEKPGSQGQGVCWSLDPCLKGLFDILLVGEHREPDLLDKLGWGPPIVSGL